MVAVRMLLDTGPLVALLHRADHHHEAIREAFRTLRGTLLTTEPVLTEAMYLLRVVPGGEAACLEFFIRVGALLVPLTRETLVRCKALVFTYADVPMDFADATLVALAEELEIKRVFTLDRRGFGVYRAKGRRALEIFP